MKENLDILMEKEFLGFDMILIFMLRDYII